MKKRPHKILALVVVFIFIAFTISIILLVKNVNTSRDNRSRASEISNCAGVLTVAVSLDGKTFQKSITLPQNPVRYYLRVTANGKPCATNFDVRSKYCDLSDKNCTAWKERSPWFSYRSNDQGVARIDLKDVNYKTSMQPGVYHATYRSAGSSFAFGNDITTIYPSSSQTMGAAAVGAINDVNNIADISQYYNAKPGYTFLYTSTNNITGKTGNTRVQIEKETGWCGITLTPWRFTKDTIDAYHYPWRFKIPWTPQLASDRDTVMRWLVPSSTYTFPPTVAPSYNNFFTAIGEKRYNRTGIRDIDPTKQIYALITGSTSRQYPAYDLGLKHNMPIPYYDVHDSNYYFYKYNRNNPAGTFPNQCLTFDGTNTSYVQPNAQPSKSWRLRAEFENIDIHGKHFSYNGPALRIDQYEKPYPISLDNGHSLRETLYLVKNIGVVRIQQKIFNNHSVDYNYGIDPTISTDCVADPDCRGDRITSPDLDAILDDYFLNPQLTIAVSTNGVNYSNTITTTKQNGYYLKATNTLFTGYVEILKPDGKPSKWLWMQDGVVRVAPGTLTTTVAGTTTMKFRVWVPDDTFPGETRSTADTQVPWSNGVTVTLQ